MAGKRSSSRYRPRRRNAILLIDYTNICRVVSERAENDQPDAVVLDLIRSLSLHMTEQSNMRPIRSVAFASLPPGRVGGHPATGAWLSAGIEARFCSARSTDEASAIEMAMEAQDISGDLGSHLAFVLLSGNRWFVPLVQRLQRRGHIVVMATLESPSDPEDIPTGCRNAYFNAEFLLGGLGESLEFENDSDDDARSHDHSQKPLTTTLIEDDLVRSTLETIDAGFGQYEEIYLTPLLRKLSEIFDGPDEEPKALINDLEEAGAVWLEKRRGFPHNYTVLMLNEDHPDVARLVESRPAPEEDARPDSNTEDYSDTGDYDDFYDD